MDKPSVGEASGETLSDPDFGLLNEPTEEGDAETPCSAANAVVATALAFPVVPNGIRPAENRDEEEIRDAREPDLRGSGAVPIWGVGVVRTGDGGGCGVGVGGGGECVREGTIVSISIGVSTGAWARRRDSEDGRAEGRELPRARDDNRCDVGDREGNGSSTSGSGSGGPGVGSGVVTVVGGSEWLIMLKAFFGVRRFGV